MKKGDREFLVLQTLKEGPEHDMKTLGKVVSKQCHSLEEVSQFLLSQKNAQDFKVYEAFELQPVMIKKIEYA